MAAYADLRTANIVRQAEWDTGGDMTLSYNGNELAGEVGELLDAAMDLVNGGDDFEAFRHEVADVIICCDLIGLRCDLELDLQPELSQPVMLVIEDSLIDLAIRSGMVCNTVKKQERARFGMVGARGSLDDLRRDLNEVVKITHEIAAVKGISAAACVAEKFNLTSRKYGLQTEMVV